MPPDTIGPVNVPPAGFVVTDTAPMIALALVAPVVLSAVLDDATAGVTVMVIE